MKFIIFCLTITVCSSCAVQGNLYIDDKKAAQHQDQVVEQQK